MIDEMARAYERTVAGISDPLDRITVRDYVREVEIGAFNSERGVTQRIRFNVALEVGRHAASVSDDVDQVISYDMIVEAIDDILSTGRINLLETCAERIAEKCLADPRSARVLVRIEKLDRIPGALGVEIVRNRVPETMRKVAPVAPNARQETRGPGPVVLVLPADKLEAGESAGWRRVLAARELPIVALVAPGALLDMAADRSAALRLGAAETRRLALLAYDQAAWAFGGPARELPVVETRTELLHALKNRLPSIWAPFKIVSESADEETDLDAVLAALVREVGASTLIRGGDTLPEISVGIETLTAATPDEFGLLLPPSVASPSLTR